MDGKLKLPKMDGVSLEDALEGILIYVFIYISSHPNQFDDLHPIPN